jgi:hypothetical protein
MKKLKNYEKEIEEMHQERRNFYKIYFEAGEKLYNKSIKIRDGLLKQYKSFFEKSPNIKEINVKEVEKEPIGLSIFGIREVAILRKNSILTRCVDNKKNKKGEVIKTIIEKNEDSEQMFYLMGISDLQILVNVINHYIEKCNSEKK